MMMQLTKQIEESEAALADARANVEHAESSLRKTKSTAARLRAEIDTLNAAVDELDAARPDTIEGIKALENQLADARNSLPDDPDGELARAAEAIEGAEAELARVVAEAGFGPDELEKQEAKLDELERKAVALGRAILAVTGAAVNLRCVRAEADPQRFASRKNAVTHAERELAEAQKQLERADEMVKAHNRKTAELHAECQQAERQIQGGQFNVTDLRARRDEIKRGLDELRRRQRTLKSAAEITAGGAAVVQGV